uniref:PUMA/OVT1 coiled-coil region domain-containing protein n=1 Tax=Parascaris equorum TaxID=6256 RepID=A0A914RW99_PAREQ
MHKIVTAKAVDEATREVRRLEERLRTAESEKTVIENARKHLEDEMRRMKLLAFSFSFNFSC